MDVTEDDNENITTLVDPEEIVDQYANRLYVYICMDTLGLICLPFGTTKYSHSTSSADILYFW